MNQRHQQDPYRSRQGSRPDQEPSRNVQGRGERYGRPYDDDPMRSHYEMSQYDEGFEDHDQYLGSHPSDQGTRYYEPNRPYAGQYAGPIPQRSPMPYRSLQGTPQRYGAPLSQPGYGGDFRPRSAQGQYAQANPYPRQAQRDFVGQGRAASSYDQGYGYGNFRQAQGYHAQPGGYARDFDEGDYDQAFGGYSPSQGGFGQSWSGYGTGGYGTMPGQDYGPAYDQEPFGTTQSSAGSGFGAGASSGYGTHYSQGLAGGRSGYGMGSGYTGSGYGQSAPNEYGTQRESNFGKGPKGYARSDERLKEDISDRLMRDFEVDASDINLEVRNGAVTLTGSVVNRQTKHYVEDLVERCIGVRDIDNRLTVRPGNSRPQGGSGSLGGSSDGGQAQAASTGTTGSRVSTGSGTSDDTSGSRSKN
jgi:hypothetical protein